MYDYFKGKIEELTPTTATVEVGGIGYIFNISLQTYAKLEGADECKLFAHQYNMRDDLPVLYGFDSRQERAVFRQLVEVSGVGGNTARTILSTYSPSELAHIIATGDSVSLKRAKGLGQKTAEKVIVELRDKILETTAHGDDKGGETAQDTSIDTAITIEAIQALQMLGFSRTASEKVVKAVIKENPGEKIEKIIKLSLKRI